MSKLYPHLDLTNFPDFVDDLIQKEDVDLDALPYIEEYERLINNKDFTSATSYLAEHAEIIEPKIITTKDFNQIAQTLNALCMYLEDAKNSVIPYCEYYGTFSEEKKYDKFSIVTYKVQNPSTGRYVTNQYFCYKTNKEEIITEEIEVDGEIVEKQYTHKYLQGILPTNVEYWGQLTLQGEQGESGTGTTPRGAWSSSVTYYADDCVGHNGRAWQCLVENTNSEPSLDNNNWAIFLDITSSTFEDVERSLEEALSNIVSGSTNDVLFSNIKSFLVTTKTILGSMIDLKTESKDNYISAINELLDTIESLETKVGDMNVLETVDKTSIVNAINEINKNIHNNTIIDDFTGASYEFGINDGKMYYKRL